MEWAKRTKAKNTPRSQKFWERREKVLHHHVLPILGDKSMSEISGILFSTLEKGIHRTLQGNRNRKEAIYAAMAVLKHHHTGR